MKKIGIIYDLFYDFDENKITVGGIQTYIIALLKLCEEIGVQCYVFQKGNKECFIQIESNCFVYQFANIKNNDQFSKSIENYSLSTGKEFKYIYATDSLVPYKKVLDNSIAIQHGISWDIPADIQRSSIRLALGQALFFIKMREKISRLDRMVCVDYSFVNWYRAQDRTYKNRNRLVTIPNFTRIYPLFKKPEDTLNIVFARRFYEYRGTRVFTNAIKRILEKYEVNVTIAGEGPDENWMKDELTGYSVSFTKYMSEDSGFFHSDKHIAVIPTVGSEGTSLSLLEAMSAQCAVICSDVGGMTNIVLDGYNGLIVRAGDSEQLYVAMKNLIEDSEMRKMLAKRAYETVKEAFSYEKWKQRWTEVIKEL